jgi:hypothetical protein
VVGAIPLLWSLADWAEAAISLRPADAEGRLYALSLAVILIREAGPPAPSHADRLARFLTEESPLLCGRSLQQNATIGIYVFPTLATSSVLKLHNCRPGRLARPANGRVSADNTVQGSPEMKVARCFTSDASWWHASWPLLDVLQLHRRKK